MPTAQVANVTEHVAGSELLQAPTTGALFPSSSLHYSALIARQPGLLGYWALDAGYGVTDLSTGGNNGTAAGGVTIGGGTGPGSLTSTDFDGSDDRVTTTFNPFANGSVRTFEGWGSADTFTVNPVLLGGGASGPFLRVNSVATSMQFTTDLSNPGGTSVTFVVTWTAGQFYHWMLVFDEPGDTARLYVNGALVSSQALAAAYNASPGNLQVGARSSSPNSFWDGKLAHVAVYDGDMSFLAPLHYAAGIATTFGEGLWPAA